MRIRRPPLAGTSGKLTGTLWLFPLATSLHNAEEAIWFPAWSVKGTMFQPVAGVGEFRFAAIVLTVLSVLVTLCALRRGGIWLLGTLGFAGAMLLNVLFPHVVMSVIAGSYTPGLVTALVCNLPVDAYLLRRALRERLVAPRALALAIACASATLLGLIPVLFALGRAFGY